MVCLAAAMVVFCRITSRRLPSFLKQYGLNYHLEEYPFSRMGNVLHFTVGNKSDPKSTAVVKWPTSIHPQSTD